MNRRHSLTLLLLVLFAWTAETPAAEDPPAAAEWSSYTLFRKPPRAARMVQPGFLWVEAEDFADYGGWRLDTQFVQQMGSAYLIAAGVGSPIDDATTTVAVPQPGKYRLWVRAKNWIPAHSPGQFTVSVDGQRAAHVFGAARTADWLWESAGEFALAAGSVKLALNDLTGYFARCDALLLTTDLDYTPPNDLPRLQAERSRLSGVSAAVHDEGSFDVIVVGGAAGSCAAVAAARLGAKTALIQDRPVLGGNASDELGVGICGASAAHPNAREGGIMEEAGRVKAHFGFQRMSEGFRIVAEGEKNLRLCCNRRVIAADMRNGQTIAAVTAADTLSGERSSYRGRLFIDCTGDGWVGYFAGAKYRLGRESRDEFGEDLAPAAADEITMSGCIMGNYTLSYLAKNVGRPSTYTPPPWAAKMPPPDKFGRNIKHLDWGDWWLEHPGDIDNLGDPEGARDELIKISFGYWDYIKNQWPQRDEASHYSLAFVPYMNARRETRRLMGDYIFKQQDAQNATLFPDRISCGGWPLDVHHPRGIFSGKEGPFDCDAHVPLYSIPYRILYSVNIENLLFAGRDLSCTHIALGTLRVQGTLSTLGQAAGTAAALCLQRGCTPRELGQRYLVELQQTLLKHDQFIPELKNEDPDDLARTATVTASSIAEYDDFPREKIQHRNSHPLNMPRALMLPRGVHRQLDSVSLLLENQRQSAVDVTLHLRGAAAGDDFSATHDLTTATAAVPAGRPTWVKFPLRYAVDQPFFWIWLPKTEGLSWGLMLNAPAGACRAYGGGGQRPWTVQPNQFYAGCTDPPIATPRDYRPENAIDGVSRIVGTTPHQWASDPKQSLPQWIELKFPRPVELNTVYLTFDTDMNDRFHDVPLVPRCVRDYRLSYFDGSTWRELAAVRDNYQRRRVHRFETCRATQLRLTVEATGGDASARVFEIRAYQEPM